MSTPQIRLEAAKLAVGMGAEIDSWPTLAYDIEQYLEKGFEVASKTKKVQDNKKDTPANKRRGR